MKQKNKILLSVFTALLLCSAVLAGQLIWQAPPTANAASTIDETIKQYEAELDKIAKDMERLKNEMGLLNSQKKDIIAEIASLDLQIDEAERRQASAESHISVVEYELTVTADIIATTEERLAERQSVFKDRIVNIYTEGELTLLDVLFSSSSFKEFLTNYDMLEKVLAQDTKLLNGIKEDIDTLKLEKAALEEQKQAWQLLNEDILNNIANLEALRTQVADKKSQLDTDIAAMGKAFDAFETDSKSLEAEIAELQRQSQLMNEGIYSWPLPVKNNYITSPYAMRKHPVTGVRSMHTGIDIRAAKGTEIYAAASGEVILSRYYGAYGECVIIDHGDGVSTLYGHMNKRAVKSGAKVKRGDVIGYVGTTGLSTGYHLHFEVRLNGKHTSPWDYVEKP